MALLKSRRDQEVTDAEAVLKRALDKGVGARSTLYVDEANELQAWAGANFARVCEDLCAIVADTGSPQSVKFNGVPAIAEPGQSAESVRLDWMALRAKVAEIEASR